jgi:hypothetical protein
MLEHHPDLTSSVIYGLGWLYLILFLMNCGWVYRSYLSDGAVKLAGQEVPIASFWAAYTALLGMISIAHLTGSNNPQSFMLRLPEAFKVFVDANFANLVAA